MAWIRMSGGSTEVEPKILYANGTDYAGFTAWVYGSGEATKLSTALKFGSTNTTTCGGFRTTTTINLTKYTRLCFTLGATSSSSLGGAVGIAKNFTRTSANPSEDCTPNVIMNTPNTYYLDVSSYHTSEYIGMACRNVYQSITKVWLE